MDCILSMTNWRTQRLWSDTKQYAANLREDQYDRNLSVFLLSGEVQVDGIFKLLLRRLSFGGTPLVRQIWEERKQVSTNITLNGIATIVFLEIVIHR